ncbi:MAG: hypothetical protein OWT27_09575 [Firmicutes bacterium]|nr:hypothetical protein [Bacillota bacterium]
MAIPIFPSGASGAPLGRLPSAPNAPAQLVNFFQSTHSAFLGWQNPSPSAYTFTLPPSGNFFSQVFGSPQQSASLMVVNLLFNGIAEGFHLAILVASYLSTPTWLLNPLVGLIDRLVAQGYAQILASVLPFLLLVLMGFVVYLFAKGRRAHLVRTVATFVVTIAAVFFLMANFTPILSFLDNTSSVATNDLGTAIENTAHSHASSEYDALWKAYIVHPFELTQFGSEGSISDFQVSNWYRGGKTYGHLTIQPGENWLTLYLDNPNPSTRSDLMEALYAPLASHASPFASGLSTTALENADPAISTGEFFIELLLIAIPMAFLGILGTILFVQAALFVLYALFAIVVLPAAILPDYGLRLTLKWVREAVGVFLHRLLNVVYLALIFLVVEGIGQITAAGNAPSAGIQTELDFVANAGIFALAIVARGKFIGLFSGLPWVDKRNWQGRRIASSQSPAGNNAPSALGRGQAGVPANGEEAETNENAGEASTTATRKKSLFQRWGNRTASSSGAAGAASSSTTSTGAARFGATTARALAFGAAVAGSRKSGKPSSRFAGESVANSGASGQKADSGQTTTGAPASRASAPSVGRSGQGTSGIQKKPVVRGGEAGGRYRLTSRTDPAPKTSEAAPEKADTAPGKADTAPSRRMAPAQRRVESPQTSTQEGEQRDRRAKRTALAEDSKSAENPRADRRIWRGGRQHSAYAVKRVGRAVQTSSQGAREDGNPSAPQSFAESREGAPTRAVRVVRSVPRPGTDRKVALRPETRRTETPASREATEEASRAGRESVREESTEEALRIARRVPSPRPTQDSPTTRPAPAAVQRVQGTQGAPVRVVSSVQTFREGEWTWRTDGNYARATRNLEEVESTTSEEQPSPRPAEPDSADSE